MASQLNDSENQFAFKKENYMWLIGGFVTVIIGFILMSGGGSEDPKGFSDAIFDTRRMVIAPLLVVAGYALVFVAIMKKVD